MFKNLQDKAKQAVDFIGVLIAIVMVFILYPSWEKDFENEEDAEQYRRKKHLW